MLTPVHKKQIVLGRPLLEGTRRAFSLRKLAPEVIEWGLTHKQASVRCDYAGRINYTLTLEQLERGLADENSRVRWKFATRQDLTPQQIKYGFTHKDASVRSIFCPAARLHIYTRTNR